MAYEDSVVIPGHWPYRIDLDGHVYGIEGNEMKGYINDKNCVQVRLNDGHRYYIHRLMWLTFKDAQPKSNEVIIHRDKDNTNNSLDNLAIWSKSKVAYWSYIDHL